MLKQAPHKQDLPSHGNATQQPANATHAVTEMNILVVEDNEINAELLEAMLRKEGHQVSHASDGFEGVHLAAKQKFDLILMDISMPNMNGIKATQAIRASQGLSRLTPIYAVTANAMPNEVVEFKAAGMAGCLLKPIQVKQLRDLLVEIACAVAVEPESDGHGVGNDKSDMLDMEQIAELIEILGSEDVRKKIDLFVTEGANLLEDLTAASLSQDSETLKTMAHKFSGSCATFGAVVMNGKLKAIETECKLGNEDQAYKLAHNVVATWTATSNAYSRI